MNKKLQDKVVKALKEVEAIYKKHNLGIRLSINFPNRKTVPFIAKVAVWIIEKYGGIIDTLYIDLTKK